MEICFTRSHRNCNGVAFLKLPNKVGGSQELAFDRLPQRSEEPYLQQRIALFLVCFNRKLSWWIRPSRRSAGLPCRSRILKRSSRIYVFPNRASPDISSESHMVDFWLETIMSGAIESSSEDG